MDAGHGCIRVLGIDFVVGLAIFLRDGKHAQSAQRFERVGGLRVHGADANGEIVDEIKQG